MTIARVAVADVPNLEAKDVALAQLAIYTEVEEGELGHVTVDLRTHPKRPDVLDLKRCLLADDLRLAPGSRCEASDSRTVSDWFNDLRRCASLAEVAIC